MPGRRERDFEVLDGGSQVRYSLECLVQLIWMRAGLRLRMFHLSAGLLLAASAIGAVPSMLPAQDAVETVRAARKVMMNDPAAALAMARDLQRRVTSFPDHTERRKGVAKANWIAGEAMLRLNRIDEARRLIDSSYAFATASGDAQSQGDSLLSRGSIKMESGDPAGALRDFLKAHHLFVRTGDARSQSITLQDLATLYMNAQDYERAELYLRQAEEVYKGEPMLQLAMAYNLANVLFEQKRYIQADVEFQRAVSIAHAMGADVLETNVLTGLALSQIRQQRLRDASRTIGKAVNASLRKGAAIGDELRLAMARLALAKGDISTARRSVNAIFADARSKQTISYKEMHFSAYEIYKAAANDKLALAHLEIATKLSDEAMALSISNKGSLLAAQFDFANQELRIAKLKADELREDVTNQQTDATRQLRLSLSIGVAVLAVMGLLSIGLLVLRRSRDKGYAANVLLKNANTALEAALHEVDQRAKAEQLATQLAEHDALTGLPNRRHLSESFQGQLQSWNKPGCELSLLLLDLDRFKPINDLYGHEVGDMVLVATAERLRALCSQHEALPVRLGGDEFVVVMTAPAGDDFPREMAAQIIRDVCASTEISGRRLAVGASIGIARQPRDGTSMEELLRAADIAMYEAKRSGRKTYAFFDPAMATQLRNYADTEVDLRSALRDGEILAYFQPIHCMRTNAITGFEALARWRHPQRGTVPPDEFIQVAEEVGLIEEVTTTILEQACQAAQDWPSHISVSVNLSPLLLRDPWIAVKIFGILSQARLPPERLIIEVTETAVIGDLAIASDMLRAFREAGIRVALEDFGKGYSSLSHLRDLSFDHLKLDASFVLTIDQDESMKIATAVAALGLALGMPVTAEGVETPEIAAKIKDLGFSFAQGYHYGRAVPRHEARVKLLSNEPCEQSERLQVVGHLS